MLSKTHYSLEKLTSINTTPQPLYVTIRLDTQDIPTHELPNRIKSFLTGEKHKVPAIKNEDRLIDNLTQTLSDELDTITSQSTYNSLIGFAQLDIDKQVCEVTDLIPLQQTVTSLLEINQTYDLRPLLLEQTLYPNIAILKIEHHQATLHSLNHEQITEVETYENQYLDRHEKEYIETSGAHQQSTIHGTGTKNYEIANQDADIQFIKDLLKDIQTKHSELIETCNYIIIYHSPKLNHAIEFSQSLLPSLPSEAITHPKLPPTPKQAISLTNKLIQDHQLETLQTKIQNQQEQYEKFLTNWENIVEAANNNRIHQLYVDLNISRPGTIDQQQQLNILKTSKSPNSLNLVPLLVNKTLNASGQVTVNPLDHMIQDTYVAALLRY